MKKGGKNLKSCKKITYLGNRKNCQIERSIKNRQIAKTLKSLILISKKSPKSQKLENHQIDKKYRQIHRNHKTEEVTKLVKIT